MKIPKGKYGFEFWRIYSSIKILIKSILRALWALVSNEGLRRLAFADEVYIRGGELCIEEFRDGWYLHGPNTFRVRIAMIQNLLQKQKYDSSWVIKSALRHIRKDWETRNENLHSKS